MTADALDRLDPDHRERALVSEHLLRADPRAPSITGRYTCAVGGGALAVFATDDDHTAAHRPVIAGRAVMRAWAMLAAAHPQAGPGAVVLAQVERSGHLRIWFEATQTKAPFTSWAPQHVGTDRVRRISTNRVTHAGTGPSSHRGRVRRPTVNMYTVPDRPPS